MVTLLQLLLNKTLLVAAITPMLT